MTVTEAMIPQVSPFSVGVGKDMTSADFTFYSTIAVSKYLSIDDPGLDSDTYDYCHALLICHLFASKSGNLELKSQSLGGQISITKDKGETSWLVDYKETITRFKKKACTQNRATDGCVRNDATMPPLELDRTTIPTFSDLEGGI